MELYIIFAIWLWLAIMGLILFLIGIDLKEAYSIFKKSKTMGFLLLNIFALVFALASYPVCLLLQIKFRK